MTAVRLELDTDGFTYRKWGGVQTCNSGDWLVDNAGDICAIDGDLFAETYSETSPGRYTKAGDVWARQATSGGSIRTLEGRTNYEAGAYLVYNKKDSEYGYAVTEDKFNELFESAD